MLYNLTTYADGDAQHLMLELVVVHVQDQKSLDW